MRIGKNLHHDNLNSSALLNYFFISVKRIKTSCSKRSFQPKLGHGLEPCKIINLFSGNLLQSVFIL